MCRFFSLVSDGNGKPYYFDWSIREQILEGKIKLESVDSHTTIADYYGFKGAKEDELNKWEYNPITKVLTADQLNTTDDSFFIQKFCDELNFKEIIPQLNLHPMIHPFKDRTTIKVSKEDLKLLKLWASVRDSVGASVRDSVWNSVRASVWTSVWDSVRGSVWASVRDSVWASVGDSVGAYISSYFFLDKWAYIKHKKGVNPYQPCIDLWNKGLVPSFDGKFWRLHGKGGKEIWKGGVDELYYFKHSEFVHNNSQYFISYGLATEIK